jgi:hypothetical protein
MIIPFPFYVHLAPIVSPVLLLVPSADASARTLITADILLADSALACWETAPTHRWFRSLQEYEV